jgi:ankyrin repeat protein
MGSGAPDLDYQDSQSNAPLHYAVQLETSDICNLLEVFLENGANPNITNERNQSPLHLLCHNVKLRNLGKFHEALRCMLHHGASPNLQSLTGCTPLHLTLYHRDIDSAVQLVNAGAELHLKWIKVRSSCNCFNQISLELSLKKPPKADEVACLLARHGIIRSSRPRHG